MGNLPDHFLSSEQFHKPLHVIYFRWSWTMSTHDGWGRTRPSESFVSQVQIQDLYLVIDFVNS